MAEINSKTELVVNGTDTAANYAALLLSDLGANVQQTYQSTQNQHANRWQESGLRNLTGYPEHALRICPVPIAEYADGALQALIALSGSPMTTQYHGADLLTLRATMTGDLRKGDVSVGGSCRFVVCADGVIALNMARDCDWELLNAWLLSDVQPDWTALAHAVRKKTKLGLIERGRLLGLAVADAQPDWPAKRSWYELTRLGQSVHARNTKPRVIDLSSLWAGPLCSRLLQWMGAEVIKVESSQRPDGARFGNAKFFQFLNNDKTEVQLDLHKQRGVAELLDLIASADIVIEGSRPRALRQMGVIAEDLVRDNPGLSWISISGYGRDEPMANWVAFGDDAAVAGGLSARIYESTGQWLFCGDAIADPLTGLHAALAAYASWTAGGGHLISLSLVNTIHHCVMTRFETAH